MAQLQQKQAAVEIAVLLAIIELCSPSSSWEKWETGRFWGHGWSSGRECRPLFLLALAPRGLLRRAPCAR